MKLRNRSSLIISVAVALGTSIMTSAFSPSDIRTKNPTSRFSAMKVAMNEFDISESETPSGDVDGTGVNIQIQQTQPETGSLLPGQVLTVKIGDTNLARKAWKKRRRSGSPILVPCTILGMNRELMVKYNIVNLLHRFGKPLSRHEASGVNNGVVLSLGAVVKLYKHRLGGNLLLHAKALGFNTIAAFLRSTFDDSFFKENGVQLIRTGAKKELALASSLSLRLARESANRASFVQFLPGNSDADDTARMVHSGTTFSVTDEEKYTTIANMPVEKMQPLSAALRISQADEHGNRIATGMECNAFLHSYDALGDNGSPLLICAIDPPREQIRDQMKRRAYVKRQVEVKEGNARLTKSQDATNLRDLKELNIGDGPFKATIARVSPRSGAAFVDLGISRQKGKKQGGGVARILGMMRFEDVLSTPSEDTSPSELTEEEAAIIEASLREGSDENEEEEIVEDDTTIYKFGDDGSVSTVDPVTNEETVIGSLNDDDDDVIEDDEDDLFAGMSPEERLAAIGEMLSEEEEKQTKKEDAAKAVAQGIQDAKASLNVGDEVDVYIRAVFPQSGRFMVTTDPSIKGRKMKDMKREKVADKRLSKLASKMGGEEGLQAILDSVGKELQGEIKATSKTGDWYYVQPICGDDSVKYPVGVAESEVEGPLSPGDKVQVRINGIDESRGQLSLIVISK